MAAQTDRLLGRAQGPGSAHWSSSTVSLGGHHINLMAFFALFMALCLCKKQLASQARESQGSVWWRCPAVRGGISKAPMENVLRWLCPAGILQSLICVLYWSSDPWKNKKTQTKRLTFMLHLHAKLFLLSPPLHYPEKKAIAATLSANFCISQYHQPF